MTHKTTRQADLAPIVHRSDKDICFRVDEVTPSERRLSYTDARQQFEKRVGRPLKAFTHDASSDIVVEQSAIEHSLVETVYLAFSQHRPLVLTPDTIWITLAQGFAHHLNAHAEALRSRLVAHKGKVTMKASAFGLANAQDWDDVIQQWSTGIQSHIPAKLYQMMLCDFSTTTPVIRTASQVVMLDAFQQYFEYEVRFICGIPTITVKGTVQDWVTIRERVDVMAGYHLEWWTDRLKPICDGFIETVQGNPSAAFWKHIYSPKEAYGERVMTGWLADLFPYIKDPYIATPTVRNPVLNVRREQLTSTSGLSPTSVPTGLSRAPFIVKWASGQQEMELIAGFIGVKQDVKTGQIEPEIGWAVVEEDESSRVFNRLASMTGEKEPSPKGTTSCTMEESYRKYGRLGSGEMPKECVRLMSTYEHGQVFYGDTPHPWILKPPSDLPPRQIWSSNVKIYSPAVHFMDLADGRGIAYVSFKPTETEPASWWIIVGKPDGQQFDRVTVIAKGFLPFLQRLTEEEGRYYFDEPQFQPDVEL